MINPRHAAFVAAHGGDHSNWEYVNFIAVMKKLYIGCIFTPISDQGGFTDFINKSAHKYQPSPTSAD